MTETLATESPRLKGSLIKRAGEHALQTTMLPPSGPVTLRGRNFEALRRQKILHYLHSLEEVKRTNSWQALLSGETAVSAGGVQLNAKRCIAKAGAAMDTSVLSWGGVLKGADYAALKRDHPMDRYKFYHSIADQNIGEAYLTELIRKAAEQGLSMTFKSFDHAYDGINIYTYHYQQMSELIQETYPDFQGAFLPTEHFLQGEVAGVDARHIGWAQEPEGGPTGHSHSVRMGIIGEALDKGGLTEQAYLEGCQAAQVRSATPWLLELQATSIN